MKRAPLPILSALLMGTSYIPFPPWAIFFCFVPLWICWFDEKSLREIFWTGMIVQIVSTAIGFNWVAHTMHEFGHMPWVPAFAILLLFCAVANLYMTLVGLIWSVFCRKLAIGPIGKIWSIAIFMSIGERTFPMIFDWNFGYTWLWAGFPAFQLADIIGFIGLANVGLAFNACFLWAWWLRREKRSWWAPAAAVPILFLAMNVAGYFHALTAGASDAQLKFLIVQANIGNDEKLLAEQGMAFRDTVINRFADLTQKGLNESGPVDFAVWPETAFPEIIDNPQMNFGYPLKLKNVILANHTKLITGGYGRLEGSGKLTNAFFILGENGWLAKPYPKTVLLAFGEYFPFADWFPKLRKMFPEVADFGRGPGPTVLDIQGVKIGAQICYEGLFDWFSRRLANQGAQVIVNVTNDSWYGTWEQPYQHAYMTLARAIEVRRPLVRSTNTGISTVALANGQILTLSPLHQEWFHKYEVPYSTNPETTIFMRWGFWLIPALLALGLILITIWSRREL